MKKIFFEKSRPFWDVTLFWVTTGKVPLCIAVEKKLDKYLESSSSHFLMNFQSFEKTEPGSRFRISNRFPDTETNKKTPILFLENG